MGIIQTADCLKIKWLKAIFTICSSYRRYQGNLSDTSVYGNINSVYIAIMTSFTI